MDPVSARSFMQDVEMRWVLDNLRQHLRSGRQWTIIEEPSFLLTAEKIDYMGNLETAHHTIGFTTGPLSAKEVDREFIRWVEWVKGRRGSQEALLIFLYHSLAGIDQAHILGLGGRDGLFSQKQVSAGTLDLSRMRLETAKGWLDSYNAQFGAPSYWEAELQTFLADLHQHYLQIRGYFQ
ncbi:MAG: hypothetical protein ER33_09415 [Cyanobium sp. CACIAM 14]|nr:MAG: hypothetical protein ER33_09415 [Cyanobium sp. CACIAM 14]